jgi:hypothetical protein
MRLFALKIGTYHPDKVVYLLGREPLAKSRHIIIAVCDCLGEIGVRGINDTGALKVGRLDSFALNRDRAALAVRLVAFRAYLCKCLACFAQIAGQLLEAGAVPGRRIAIRYGISGLIYWRINHGRTRSRAGKQEKRSYKKANA